MNKFYILSCFLYILLYVDVLLNMTVFVRINSCWFTKCDYVYCLYCLYCLCATVAFVKCGHFLFVVICGNNLFTAGFIVTLVKYGHAYYFIMVFYELGLASCVFLLVKLCQMYLCFIKCHCYIHSFRTSILK